MDNFGYKNWGNNDNSNDESDQSSPEKYFHQNINGKQEEGSYDFDASYDFVNSPIINKKKTRRNSTSDVFQQSDSSNRYNSTSNLRRVSIDDRAKAILERNKSLKLGDSFEEDNLRLKSYEDTLAELREGGYLQSSDYSNDIMEYTEPPVMKTSPNFQSSKQLDSPLDSPFGGDSLEISAADLEVGTYSKRIQERKLKERIPDRGRRMSFDHKSSANAGDPSYQSIPLNVKIASSPDIFKTRRSNTAGIEIKSDALDNRLQFSTALSSIHKSHTVGELIDKDSSKYNNSVAHYGSMERSDDDIYKMLNVTTETQESMKFGNQDSILDNSIPIHKKKIPSTGDLSDVTQRSASPQMNYNNRMDPVTSITMNDQAYDSDENQEEEDSMDGSGNSNFPLDDNKMKDLVISTDNKNNENKNDEDEDEYSLDEFEDPSPLKQNTIPLDPVDEIRQRWYNAESSDFLQKLSITDSYSNINKQLGQEVEQSSLSNHDNVLNGSKLNKSPETIVDNHDNEQSKANEIGEYTNETNIQRNSYDIAANSSLLNNSHQSTMNSSVDNVNYVDNSSSSLMASKHNLFISTVGSASLVTSIPPAAPPTMADSRDVQSKISCTESSHTIQINMMPRPSLGNIFPMVNTAENLIGQPDNASVTIVRRSSISHSDSLEEEEEGHVGEREEKEDRESEDDLPKRYDNETKNEKNIFDNNIDNKANLTKTNHYGDNLNQISNPSEYLSIDNLPRYSEDKRVNNPSSSIIIPNTQPMKVPNLYRRSSGINLSTGSMVTYLSAASRYQTTSEDEAEDNQHILKQQHSLLNPNLRHSIVASIIESTYEDPPKLYYEASLHDSHDQYHRGLLCSEENDIKYIATKLPGTSLQSGPFPWYPSDVNPEKTLIKEKTIHTRLATATALKIKQHFLLTPTEREKQRKIRPRYGISKSIATPTISKSFKENPPIITSQHNNELQELERNSREAVNRLTQENWRLFRKYERLEQGLHELKYFKDLSTNNDNNVTTNNTKSDKYSNKLKELRTESYNNNKIITDNLTTQDNKIITPLIDDMKEPWEIKIESALCHLQDGNEKLLAREKAIVVREEALTIREHALENKEKLLISSTFYKKTKDQSKNDVFLEEELSILREKEHELLLEIDRLKAMIFNNDQAKNIIDANTIKEKQGFNPDLDLSKSYQLLLNKYTANKHKTGSLLSKNTTTNATNNNDNNNNDKEILQQLLNENATQERLLDGFQKENERLLTILKQQEVEYNMRMSIFYDQREEMNKELNKLRNKHHQHTDNNHISSTHIGNYKYSNMSTNNDNMEFDHSIDMKYQTYDDKMLPTARKTAESLRMELNMDATIRTLKDKVAEAESQMSERERELQVTIEKLNRENRELITTISSLKLSQTPCIPQDQDYIQLQTENKNYQSEIDSLKHKLKWYIENQKLIDQIDTELSQYKTANHAMRKELLKRGMENKAIERMVTNETTLHSSKLKKIPTEHDQDDYSFTQIEPSTSPHMDRSSLSSVVTRNRTQHRNFADVKKIKELEGVIRDLQDSLIKRHPDSVANLIRAATVSDSIQLKHHKQEEYIASLQEEVKNHKELYERKLRSLRQEHEKVKQQYIETFSNLQQQLHIQPSISIMNRMKSKSLNSSNSISNTNPSNTEIDHLNQANERINELELEIDRIRAFYTKKLQDNQHKSESQIRALKRGQQQPTLFTPAVGDGTTAAAIVSNRDAFISEKINEEEYNLIQNQNEKITKFYADRLLLLEKELMITAEELGKLKATTSSSTINNNSNINNIDNIPKFYHTTNVIDINNMDNNNSNVLNNILKEKEILESQRKDDLVNYSKERSSLQQSFDNKIKEISINHQHYIEQITNIWKIERDNLMKRLEEEELRCKDLRKELLTIISSTNSNNQTSLGYQESKSLELSQFQQMENQMNTLEKRLMRRDQELSAAVEESKQAARIERSRLEALHSHELNEKDQQLVKFQQELIQLVSLLRQQRQAK